MNAPRILTLSALMVGMTACSGASGTVVNVAGTADGCQLDKTELDAGEVTLEFRNKSGKVNQLYVMTAGGSVVGEIQNLVTGTKGSLTVDVAAGEYVAVCTPGLTGDGFATNFSVTGEGGPPALQPEKFFDIAATDFAFGLPGALDIRAGDIVEFAMINAADFEKHEMEVVDPDGIALGEVGPTVAGVTGRVTLELSKSGTYSFVCGIEDHVAKGMRAEFVVTQ